MDSNNDINNHINNHFSVRTLGVLLLGPGGCGKDTQAEKILGHYGAGATHISVSGLIKKKMGEDKGFAEFARPILNRSDLLPDETIHSLVMDEVSRLQSERFQGIVMLNGYPRSRRQATWLRNIFKHPDAVLAVEFSVELHEVIKRSQNRNRDDDNNIEKRFQQYHKNRESVFRKLRSQGVTVVTLGAGSINEVYGELITLMRRHAVDVFGHQRELAERADACFAAVDRAGQEVTAS